MDFVKFHGLGNDFIVVRAERLPDDASALAARLCDRHFGIGGDGLVFVLPSAKADFMMRIMNADGSEAEQCGNAIRCVAKYVYDRGLMDTNRTTLTVETIGAGVQNLQLTVHGGKVETARVDMGEPVLDGLKVPTAIDASPVLNYPVVADGRQFLCTAVSMGNPHCVIFAEDAAAIDLHTWGPKLESHPLFPRKTNVEFVTVQARDRFDMRVWERGAGPTLACGTGACAALVACVLAGRTERAAAVSLEGGDLLIEWSEADNRVYMTGPAEEVFTGVLPR